MTERLRFLRAVHRLDLVLAVCLIGVAVVNGFTVDGRETPGNAGPEVWWEWLVLVAPAGPVAFRRVWPLQATPVSVLAQMVVWAVGLAAPFFAPLVMIYTVAAQGERRGRLVAAGSSIALSATAFVGVFVAPDVTVDLFLLTVLACIGMYVLGVTVADQRLEGERLAAGLAVAEVERAAAQERAVAGERQRIARELHDIVGHSLSVIAVRSEAASRVGSKNPSAVVDAVDAIAATARASLAEVRRVLAGLRPDEGQVAALAPAASVGSLPALVRSVSEAGLQVEVVSELPADGEVGSVVGIGAYRIIQEALTNVIRHAGPGAAVELAVEVRGPLLHITVDDDGGGLEPVLPADPIGQSGRADRSAVAAADAVAGVGITGMAARADVLGGALQAGPRPGGGFRVAASLPLEESAGSARPAVRVDGSSGVVGREQP